MRRIWRFCRMLAENVRASWRAVIDLEGGTDGWGGLL